MESLPPKTQEQIKKMSTEYLVLKLTKTGLDEDAILKISRDHLMPAWAELVAPGKDKPAVAVGAEIVGTSAASFPELEKRHLAFEMQKYQEEKAERLRLETVRLHQIADEKAERLRLEAKADAERLWLEARADAERLR